MTKVAILPERAGTDGVTYRAVAGKLQAAGRTAGEALDGLVAQLSEEEAGTLVIVQNMQPDRFFTADQQLRLEDLMARWRAARDADAALPAEEQAELDRLVEAELRAATERARAMLHELGR